MRTWLAAWLAAVVWACGNDGGTGPAGDGGLGDGAAADGPADAGDGDAPEAAVDAGPTCFDSMKNGDETDLDCGGSCDPCDEGALCGAPSDCESAVCTAGRCAGPRCGDGVVQSGELCDDGAANSDTEPDACRTTCQTARCGDGVEDSDEACDVDAPFCTASCELVSCTVGVDGASVALLAANPACGRVLVPIGTYAENVQVTRDVTVTGAGNEAILDGAEAAPVFTVAAGARLTLEHLTVRRGYYDTISGGGARSGGGIRVLGELVARDVVFTDNEASYGGGAVWVGGAATFEDCSFSDNVAGDFGGAISVDLDRTLVVRRSTFHQNRAGEGGAIYAWRGTLTIEDSTFTENFADGDSGNAWARGGALWLWDSTTHIARSTFRANRADSAWGGVGHQAHGGAIWNDASTGENVALLDIEASLFVENLAVTGNSAAGGGAIESRCGTGDSQAILRLRNSTLSGNRADNEGHSSWGGAVHSYPLTGNCAAKAYFSNVTITENEAARGAGVALRGGASPPFGVYEWRNSVVAGNELLSPTDGSPAKGPDCETGFDTTIVSMGHNLLGDDADCVLGGDGTGDLRGVDADLEALDDHGGPTETHALAAESPAVNAGDPDGCVDETGATLSTDQRGYGRPAGGRCDIGAFEYGATGP